MSGSYYGFKPYVPVATRQKQAKAKMAQLEKKGKQILPVKLTSRLIANSFWAKSWCENLESYMDYANRLPRGRTYVRNGSVVHLDIKAGEIEAKVSGSEIYKVEISIKPMAPQKWKSLVEECAGGVGSLVELWQGKLSKQVMEILTRKGTGMFPSPKEIEIDCSCPDWAVLCKHAAAVLYGVGARLDNQPELLFLLRSVNHEDLLTHASQALQNLGQPDSKEPEIAEADLSELFGIELDEQPAPSPTTTKARVKKPKAEASETVKAVKKLPKRTVKKTPTKTPKKETPKSPSSVKKTTPPKKVRAKGKTK